jgi:glycosyltransferase involved in cell wall biosynthesis
MSQKLLLITDRHMNNLSKGNVRRICNLVKLFHRIGFRIALICPDPGPDPELASCCERLITVSDDSFIGGKISNYKPTGYITATNLVSLEFLPSLVIAEYAWMAPCLDVIPCQCMKILDTHDLLSERTKRFAEKNLDPWVDCTIAEERTLLEKADIIFAIQELDQSKLKEMLPYHKIVFVPHFEEPSKIKQYAQNGTPCLGFVGSAHQGNSGIVDFVRHCLPMIKDSIPQAALTILGSSGLWFENRKDIKIIPWIEDISSFYDNTTVVVCPITIGTGLKIKLIEALSYGKAIIATNEAVEGMPACFGNPFLVAEDWNDFARKVVELIGNAALRSRVESEAILYADKYFSFDAFERIIKNSLLT